MNLGTTTSSTNSIGQLKALQKVFSIELNKITVRLTNFIFEIESILSISIINLDISL